MELALDLMGESRLAAALARVCAFKPSWGLVSRYGLIGLIPSMEGCALLSRDTIRIREALTVLAGPDERDISLPDEGGADFCPAAIHPEETILGYIREVQEALAPEVREAFDKDLADLQGAGFPVKSLSFPEFPLFSLVHGIVGAVEASSSAGRYDSVRYGQRTPGARNWNDMYLQSRGGAFGTLLKGYLFQGAYFQFEAYDAYEDACRIRARLVKAMEGLLNQAAFLVFPAINPAASPQAASPADLYDRFRFTLFANVTGQPALYLPSSGGGGAPGLQWVGARRSDAGLLDLGDFLLRLSQGGV
jgi:aspartyl-tRNA(Asn)/glutamyl-tRNA(Gln) amidotransferase subunit A